MIALPILLFVALALVCGRLTLGSLRTFTALRRPSKPVGSLAPGPAQVAGTLRASTAPLAAIDGTPAILVSTRIGYTHEDDDGTHTVEDALREVRAVSVAEITDPTGSCTFDTTEVMVLAEPRTMSAAGAEFRERHPDLWARMAVASSHEVRRVDVRQTVVADGATGIVSGVATSGLESAFHLGGTAEWPVFVTASPEPEMSSTLLRPVLLFAGLTCLNLAVAGALGFFAYVAWV